MPEPRNDPAAAPMVTQTPPCECCGTIPCQKLRPESAPVLASTRDEGWYGGILVHFDPKVTREQVNELLAAMCRRLREQDTVPVVSATFQGPKT